MKKEVTTPRAKSIRGWHFLDSDNRLGYGDGRRVTPGCTLSVPWPEHVEPCKYGLHASRFLSDAANFAPSIYSGSLTYVELTGVILGHRTYVNGAYRIDKYVASTRRVIHGPHRLRDIKRYLDPSGKRHNILDFTEKEVLRAMREMDEMWNREAIQSPQGGRDNQTQEDQS